MNISEDEIKKYLERLLQLQGIRAADSLPEVRPS